MCHRLFCIHAGPNSLAVQHKDFVRKSLEKTKPSIPLVFLNDHNRLEINKEAVILLRTLTHKPVAVLGIYGPYRSGKSYFMSRLIGSNDFEVSHGKGVCTKGIWMSTSVLECDEFYIVVLDSEGAGTAEATERGSEEIVFKYLIITTLICSYFIYNSIGISRLHLDQMR